jgi:endo-beta-N-acetylglucosaminidase D
MAGAARYLLLTASILLLSSGVADGQPPGQPFASYWFPNELLAWTPAADADSPYNRSAIELATRSTGDTQANVHARVDEAKIAALSIMYPSTSGNPSQGAAVFDVYAFNYWQYTDRLVLWGGSAGEGLILAPSADVIDAGHRNGVPVYGTVFFPPTVYGGQIQWVQDFVQNSGGNFPVADKLIEVAEYYGFDGWFINQETAGGSSALALDMRNMMEYIQLNSDISIMWYDAMVESGSISWQNALNSSNDMFFEDGGTISNEMFLNFWWSTGGLASSAALATGLGRSPYELYSGVDVQANGYNTGVNWAGVFPESSPHVTSLGFYCPNWCYSSSTSHPDFYSKANRFWVGANRDPSNTETTHPWKGMAHYVPATTPVTEIPFVTNFNTGQGHQFSVDGDRLGNTDWNNRSLQDVLPTYRWMVDCSGTALYPELDWSDAYWGGTNLKVSGDLYPGTPNVLYLYKTDATLSSGDILLVAFKTGSIGTPSNLEIGLAFEDPETFDYFSMGNSTTEDWNTVTTDLSAFSGRELSVIALRFDASSTVAGYEINIGRIGIISGTQDTPAPPTGLYVESFQQMDDDHGTVRLRWDHSTDQVYMYNVYRVNADNSRSWLWSTPNNACFVPELVREAPETSTTIEVVTVGNEFGISSADTVSIDWTITGCEESSTLGCFGISDNYRNPMVSNTSIGFSTLAEGHVSLSLYSLDGRLVSRLVNEPMPAGNHASVLETDILASGVYFLRLESDGSVDTGKCIVIR